MQLQMSIYLKGYKQLNAAPKAGDLQEGLFEFSTFVYALNVKEQHHYKMFTKISIVYTTCSNNIKDKFSRRQIT